MGAVHVHVHGLEDGKLNKRVHPWTIQQTGNVDGDGTGVECKQIGVLHQRTTALEELLTDVLAGVLLPTDDELLELGGTLLLTLAVVGIVKIEGTSQQIALGQPLIGFTLLFVVIELATLLTQQEEKVYLALIIGQRTLIGVKQESCHCTQHKAPEAPVGIEERHGLVPQTVYDAQVDTHEPQVASKTIEHTSYQGFLACDTGHLTIGRIAEVGKHQ